MCRAKILFYSSVFLHIIDRYLISISHQNQEKIRLMCGDLGFRVGDLEFRVKIALNSNDYRE